METGGGHSLCQDGWHTILMEFFCDAVSVLFASWFSGVLWVTASLSLAPSILGIL